MDFVMVLFELVYVFNLIGSLILIANIHVKRHTEGISYYTQLLFGLASIIKFYYFYYSILSEHWLFWAESLLSIFVSGYMIWLMFRFKPLSLNKEQNFWDYRVIIVVSALLAVASNYERSKRKFEWYFFAIRFANIIEALGLLPQLRVMRNEKFVSKPIGFFLLSLMISRIFRIWFWVALFQSYYSKDKYYILIGADALYVVLLLDFAYFFWKYRKDQVIPYN